MNALSPASYPRFEDHQRAWEELARGIAGLKERVRRSGEASSGSRRGELIIIGSGIETVGFSLGDQKILEAADKVLYCVADPATVVWLKRLRPDALDLYVLYGEDKIRYTTYMQMAEAQLFWVRQGLKVAVVFYGHPGVFVLSTHRAIRLARREGHRAVMKAGVCALDTLCADLGIDPSHPGLQTHEATDCLTRRRRIDTTLHVILWQVGLIGELGYRRQGYLNSNFSYFVSWLQEIYGADYPVTHYIGSRYPSIDPLIETHSLQDLHSPAVQTGITGLSTFYIPPRDVVPTDPRTAADLGLLRQGQRLATPASPLREIDKYGPREMAAFAAFEGFRIPPSYKWQDETEASKFLIELRFDIALQELYRRDPLKALEDPRFASLSDRERALLASRDSGAIQVAAKGAYKRSPANEHLIDLLLNSRTASADLLRRIHGKPSGEARDTLLGWITAQNIAFDAAQFHSSVDFTYRNNLYPWTGVYAAEEGEILVTLLGNRSSRDRSILYLNGTRIGTFQFANGVLRWNAGGKLPFSGFLKFDLQAGGGRRLIGKIWSATEKLADAPTFVAAELDPGRKLLEPRLAAFHRARDPGRLAGNYALRTGGRFFREVTPLSLGGTDLTINGEPVAAFAIKGPALTWTGGSKACFSGRLEFLLDPIIDSVELYGETASAEEPGTFKCYGARLAEGEPTYCGPPVASWAQAHLLNIAASNRKKGGLMLWHKWEKYHLTSMALGKHIAALI